ncbi:mandelate racemase/muconate lactonizing enzyme family protein [Martelella lutilitoris]|uniref:Mandelate racemase/muconate lactonizing enzyme family protein n=1 Tax=Martelella lutilitoris TaxID=2583532 RepID=A0A5C4JUQ7_9HYPH|nr:mandelate racemase/muconate lactonizing enzyme family protein [Martelella lutilitoris]TNB48901.1 mandelate racemase/muconate lactonizing enzyme family protein [Martelella lutilitoris]
MPDAAAHPIADIIAHPLTQKLPTPTETSWGRYDAVSIMLVEVRTTTGLTGYGETLARFAPCAYAELVEHALKPRLVGRDALDISANWALMRRSLSGRAGGMLIEAIAGVDIALWDIAGKACGLPIYRLLGGEGRAAVPVYAASVSWDPLEERAAEQAIAFARRGFSSIKVKIGRSPEAACKRIATVREAVGDGVELTADSNWAYNLDEAVMVSKALESRGYAWFEEPVRPEDEDGYRQLRARCAVPLAAGESNYTVDQAMALTCDRTLSVLQPNVTRSGGITETLAMARLAAQHDVAYAPHVGMSGIICEAASLHVAAAAANTRIMECAASANLFKSEVADLRPGGERAEGGMLSVPQGPGLGIEINWEGVARMEKMAREAA